MTQEGSDVTIMENFEQSFDIGDLSNNFDMKLSGGGDFVTDQRNGSSQSTSLSSDSDGRSRMPFFHYDHDIYRLCERYLQDRNHQGLALVARQRGLPPFLRFKIWPILLKHHPFVLNPFILPDDRIEDDELKSEEELASEVQRDLHKYVKRLNYTNAREPSSFTDIEIQFFKILEHSILKFINKWGRIINYDEALAWMALELAEWFPPIPHTSHVLIGRDVTSEQNVFTKDLFSDYQDFIDELNIKDTLQRLVQEDEMTYQDVYERLVLILLHAPEDKVRLGAQKTLNKKILPINGGTIEERVSFFIYCLRKLLPELSQYFHEEKMLNKFGSHDDEWLIWWLKWCGSKVWSRIDRGRIWDLMFGWRVQNPRKSKTYYWNKLDIEPTLLARLGPDTFWSVGEESDTESAVDFRKSNSFKDLINELNTIESSNSGSPTLNSPCYSNTAGLSKVSRSSQSSFEKPKFENISIPFSKLDPHIELIFVTLALLKSKENILFELDQHEIRQFLSRLPSNSPFKSKYKYHKSEILLGGGMSSEGLDISKLDYMEHIINEAGELWRKWLWQEIIDDD